MGESHGGRALLLALATPTAATSGSSSHRSKLRREAEEGWSLRLACRSVALGCGRLG